MSDIPINFGELAARLEARLDAMERLEQERLETVNRRITETVASGEKSIDHLGTLSIERDRRYQDRFEASEKAVAAAFAAAEQAVQAAMEAAEKAITKAEISIEKRADATYVAIGELQSLLQSLLPRHEADSKFANLEDQLSSNTVRIERMEAAKVGSVEQKQSMSEGVKMAATIGTIILAAITIIGIIAATGVFRR